MQIKELEEILNKIAPLDTQEDWDNSGMQLSFGDEDVSKVLVAMEITDKVIDEAVSSDADMIVCHHPLYFNELKHVDGTESSGRYTVRLIENHIAVYASHTPFDFAPKGNNAYLMKLVGAVDFNGFSAQLPEEMSFLDFAKKLAGVLGNPLDVRLVGDIDRKIKKISVCTGSGAEFIGEAISRKCDCFITGDLKHHDAQYARENGLCVIDAGHWGTEHTFVDNMSEQLADACCGRLEIIKSKVNQNPVDYVLK